MSKKKFKDLSLKEIMKICEAQCGCGSCPLVIRTKNLVFNVCSLPIKAIEDLEVDIYE